MTNFQIVGAVNNHLDEVNLVKTEPPLMKLLLNNEQIIQLINQSNQLEIRITEKLRKKIGRFHSASMINRQITEQSKVFKQLQDLKSHLGQSLSAEDFRVMYDLLCQYIDLLLKEFPLKTGQSILEMTENKEISFDTIKSAISQLFDEVAAINLSISQADLLTDVIGINNEGTLFAFYICPSYDVLYQFPTMFKTEDMPCFVCNLSKFLVRDLSKGKTKTAITEFAYERIFKGLGLKHESATTFLFRMNVFASVNCAPQVLPLINAQKRFMVYKVQSIQKYTQYEQVQYIDKKFGRMIEQTAVEIPRVIEADFLVIPFKEKSTRKTDDHYLPMIAVKMMSYTQIEQFIQDEIDWKDYHFMLLNEYMKLREAE